MNMPKLVQDLAVAAQELSCIPNMPTTSVSRCGNYINSWLGQMYNPPTHWANLKSSLTDMLSSYRAGQTSSAFVHRWPLPQVI